MGANLRPLMAAALVLVLLLGTRYLLAGEPGPASFQAPSPTTLAATATGTPTATTDLVTVASDSRSDLAVDNLMKLRDADRPAQADRLLTIRYVEPVPAGTPLAVLLDYAQ